MAETRRPPTVRDETENIPSSKIKSHPSAILVSSLPRAGNLFHQYRPSGLVFRHRQRSFRHAIRAETSGRTLQNTTLVHNMLKNLSNFAASGQPNLIDSELAGFFSFVVLGWEQGSRRPDGKILLLSIASRPVPQGRPGTANYQSVDPGFGSEPTDSLHACAYPSKFEAWAADEVGSTAGLRTAMLLQRSDRKSELQDSMRVDLQ